MLVLVALLLVAAFELVFEPLFELVLVLVLEIEDDTLEDDLTKDWYSLYSRLADDDESVPLLELFELIEEDMLDDITNDRGREERLRKKLEEMEWNSPWSGIE